jgi:hypothetical protein
MDFLKFQNLSKVREEVRETLDRSWRLSDEAKANIAELKQSC